MSGQWEVVGRKKGKDNGNTGKKPIVNKKKNFVVNTPKVEEVLPLQQIKNLYNAGKNKENKKPQEKKEEVKKPPKKEKPQEATAPKPKPPKTIESALNSIKVDEFKSVFEDSKRLFPDAPLVWLKECVQFLNQRMPVDIQDVTFSSKSHSYPFSAVPASLQNAIKHSTKEAGASNAQLFFDISLTAMANDMSKSLSAIGHKLYIQHLALSEPQLVLTNLSKHITLRNSYVNRQPIGLSILWAIGQAGIKDLNVGLQVFQELMLPVIEMKNYARYVVQFLIQLLTIHNSSISTDHYLLILDVAFANFKNFPNDLRQSLQKSVQKLEQMLFAQKEASCHEFVEPLLKKIQSNNSNNYKDEICKILAGCLCKDQSTFNSWNKSYIKNLPQSAILLNYLDRKWDTFSKQINKKLFKELLDTYTATNDELLTKKRKEAGLLDAVQAIKRLNDKMAAKKKSGFPYKFFSFVVVVIIGGIVYYDIRRQGSWEKSRTFVGLKQAGILDYSNKALDKSQEGLYWLHQRIDEQFPGYYEKSDEFLQPYIKVTKELGLVLYNIFGNFRDAVVEKYPVVIASIESYAPGVLEQSQKTINDAWTTSVLYVNRGIDYLKTEVFVGQLAPENMQRVVLEAINTTQQKATECYHWLYEKVQSTIK